MDFYNIDFDEANDKMFTYENDKEKVKLSDDDLN